MTGSTVTLSNNCDWLLDDERSFLLVVAYLVVAAVALVLRTS